MTTELPEVEQVIKDLQTTPAEGATGEATVLDAVLPDIPAPRGFQSSFVARPQWPREADADAPGFSQPKPMPKRPKGRFLIGGLLAAICLTVAWAVWDSFLGVAAYGVVTGDTLRVAAPWDGQLAELHVTDGESIAQGQLLASIVSPELARQISRTKDELKVEQARLDAESSRIRWQAGENAAEYFELWGSLQKNRQELSRLEREQKRAESVGEFIPKEELEKLKFAASGMRDLIEKLEAALEKRRQRAEPSHDGEAEPGWDQLQPVLARIESLQAELCRLERQLEEGELRSPVDGVVTRVHHMNGQRVASLETVLEIVDTGSLEATLFMPQDESRTLPVGTEVTLKIEPLQQKRTYQVVGTRERFESAPSAIRRYYLSDQQLLPVILRPTSPPPKRESENEPGIQIGAVVKLTWFNHLGIKHGEPIDDLSRITDESNIASREGQGIRRQ